MRAQVTRIGAAWENIEQMLLDADAKYTANGQTESFKKRDLRQQWIDWMTKYHKERLDDLNKILKEKVKVFDGGSTSIARLKRWDYSGIFSRSGGSDGGPKKPKCGSETNSKRMEERQKLLVKVFGEQKDVDSELKLD
jgi:hypothetical protein